MADRDGGRLFRFEFLALNLVIFFSFCNMAVFYSFFHYLEELGIPAEWRGFLVGLEPMSAFLLRLAVIPMLHAGNAVTVLLIALTMIVVALTSYGWVVSIPGLVALRIFHGAAFVLLVSASMALVVHFIPKEKSGQGFGIVSVSILVPYAVMPFLTETALHYIHDEAEIYRDVTILAVPAYVLLFKLRSRLKSAVKDTEAALIRRPRWEEIRSNLKDPGITVLLAVNFFLYLCYATVFFFMKEHTLGNGIGEVGSFFTISTVVMIVLRLSGGFFFDKIDKARTLRVFTLLLIPCFILIGQMHSGRTLWIMAACYGLCIGFIMPLLNALLFDISPPQLRGVNTNLALFVMDAGFFLSPYAGGAFIASGHSFAALFQICAGCILINFLLLVLFKRLPKVPRKGTTV